MQTKSGRKGKCDNLFTSSREQMKLNERKQEAMLERERGNREREKYQSQHGEQESVTLFNILLRERIRDPFVCSLMQYNIRLLGLEVVRDWNPILDGVKLVCHLSKKNNSFGIIANNWTR